MAVQIKDISWFVSICAGNDLMLSDEQAASFENYRKLLLSWNARINLISRKDEANFYPSHALNCISFLFNRRLKPDAKILDLGTGGGLPGIPLKIVIPDLNLTLLDSISKKTTALSDIVKEMRLEKVEVVTDRAENLAKLDEFKGKFDYVITRAAGKLDELIRWSRGLLRSFASQGSNVIPIGSLIVLKGGTIDDELRLSRKIKFIESIESANIVSHGTDEIENKDKKLILIKYRTTGKNI